MNTGDCPQVSIVIPMFNAQNWISQTLDSVASQSFSDWEIIVVDDGSTDSGVAKVQQFSSTVTQTVRIMETENRGPSAARNLGIHEARGKYVALLDSDDLWHLEKLTDQVNLLESQTDAIGCICNYEIQSGFDGPIIRRHSFQWSKKKLDDWALMEDGSPCLDSTLLATREVLLEIGGFRTNMTNAEDLELAYQLNQLGPILNTGKTQMTYRFHDQQNHRDRTTMIRDYRAFIGRWQEPKSSLYKRGMANVELLTALDMWERKNKVGSLNYSIRSVSKAPLQWLRLLKGVRRRRACDTSSL